MVAGVGERLQLDGWLFDFLSCLGLDDGPFDVLLQVYEAPVVAQCPPRRDVRILHEKGVSDPVCAHDIVHVHADRVANFGGQGGVGGGG